MLKIGYDLIVVSDLHLSEGWGEKTHRISRNEDFFFDVSFRRFLDYLRAQHKTYKLIINGDFVDFLQVTTVPDTIPGEEITERERKFGLGTTPAKTVWKLKRIMNGHWIFFKALAEFLADDRENEVYILPGNHDIEFVMPDVQEAFREELPSYSPKESISQQDKIKERIKFLPWFYYDEQYSIYVEHGSQYDALNSFDYFLCPYRPDGTIDLPAGSFFVRYLFNRVELDYPFADNMKPVSRFMKWFVRRLLYRWSLSQAVKYVRFFAQIFAKAGPIEPAWSKKLESEQEKIIKGMASIDSNKLFLIKAMWIPSAIHNDPWYRLLWKFFMYSLSSGYWREKARRIHKALGIRYIVFGHTHEVDLYDISKDGDGIKIEYINSGTWTKGFAENYEEMLLEEENEFAYVHLRREGERIRMELLRWNDNLGKGERIKLFEEKK
jgi:UDP-2,3-diacylglucosamine pyrophosphatase LpxH